MNDLSFFRDSRVLITGGAGMIGSTIARLLVEQGAEVTVVDAMLPTYGGNRFNLNGIMDKMVFVKGDIRDLDRVKEWVDGADYVFSLAAQVSYVDSNHDPLHRPGHQLPGPPQSAPGPEPHQPAGQGGLHQLALRLWHHRV